MLPMELERKFIDNITELRIESFDFVYLSCFDKVGKEICRHVD